MNYSRAIGVLRTLRYIMEHHVYHPPMLLPIVKNLTLPDSDNLFARIYKEFIGHIYGNTVNLIRKDEISYGTAYKLVKKIDIEWNIGKKRARK